MSSYSSSPISWHIDISFWMKLETQFQRDCEDKEWRTLLSAHPLVTTSCSSCCDGHQLPEGFLNFRDTDRAVSCPKPKSPYLSLSVPGWHGTAVKIRPAFKWSGAEWTPWAHPWPMCKGLNDSVFLPSFAYEPGTILLSLLFQMKTGDQRLSDLFKVTSLASNQSFWL